MFLRSTTRSPAVRTLARNYTAKATAQPFDWGRLGRNFIGVGVTGLVTGLAVTFYPQQSFAEQETLIGRSKEEIEKTMMKALETNSAFVFIKPHAVTPEVQDLVTDVFQKAGITIISQGDLDYKTIDEEMLIDTHYGAIANRAVKQDPKDLIVSAKGQAGFEEMFGMSWADALASGNVYNAKQACEKLGCDGFELEQKWGKLSKKTEMIKFGGGFYCGKVDGLFVLNGFYMAMRAAYTTAPATLHYYTVEWPADELSWEDFRGKVLGATDPATAAEGSARRMILEDYQKLGLKGKPNTGDNGVHASASPLEALVERMNWLKVNPEDDLYGQAMIIGGVSAERLAAWGSDPVVDYEGVKGSLFDNLEDLNAKECWFMAHKISAEN